MFLVASHILDVAKGAYGDEGAAYWPPEMEERLKYAKWKAIDIIKAINEGRQPAPGPPASNQSAFEAMPPPSQPTSLSQAPSFPQSPSPINYGGPSQPAYGFQAAPEPSVQLPPVYSQPPPPPPAPYNPPPTYNPPPVNVPIQPPLPPIQRPVVVAQLPPPPVRGAHVAAHASPHTAAIISRAKLMTDAEKYTRYGLSSVQFEDVPSAIVNLQHALQILEQLRQASS